jgi:hypothetical protein
MNRTVRAYASLFVLLLAGASLGQDNAPPRPAAPPPAPEAEQPAETPPPAAERPEVANDEFIPTEELNPDAAITFPVDI